MQPRLHTEWGARTLRLEPPCPRLSEMSTLKLRHVGYSRRHPLASVAEPGLFSRGPDPQTWALLSTCASQRGHMFPKTQEMVNPGPCSGATGHTYHTLMAILPAVF